jgi:hypothetical protein
MPLLRKTTYKHSHLFLHNHASYATKKEKDMDHELQMLHTKEKHQNIYLYTLAHNICNSTLSPLPLHHLSFSIHLIPHFLDVDIMLNF